MLPCFSLNGSAQSASVHAVLLSKFYQHSVLSRNAPYALDICRGQTRVNYFFALYSINRLSVAGITQPLHMQRLIVVQVMRFDARSPVPLKPRIFVAF